MLKIKLDTKKVKHGISTWLSCPPFVQNSKAVLIHRPRFVSTYKIGEKWKSHIGIGHYCGNSACGNKKFTFLDTLSDEMILCAVCENNALLAGLPSAESIVGKHVHIGGVKAVKHCCIDMECEK